MMMKPIRFQMRSCPITSAAARSVIASPSSRKSVIRIAPPNNAIEDK